MLHINFYCFLNSCKVHRLIEYFKLILKYAKTKLISSQLFPNQVVHQGTRHPIYVSTLILLTHK